MILQINLEENCVLYQISIDLFNLKKKKKKKKTILVD